MPLVYKLIMPNNKKVPESTISRLFVYLREVSKLSKVNIRTISSGELGDITNLSDAQIRKDLGYFGQFGVSGAGYNVLELKKVLEKILGKDKAWNVAIVGTGHLGSALLSYSEFANRGLRIIATFDADQRKVGKRFKDIITQPIDQIKETVSKKKIAIGIITVPPESAQGVADMLTGAGIKFILNFAPIYLNVSKDVKVNNIDVSRELETLSYYLAIEAGTRHKGTRPY